ncbi:MAG: 2-C-methyl-D-erythritol 4-phosphate cytidylyltransferase [bacterium]|nr:2-C-methyl-D-erythritol 4-phosphate cytidylyltransferase [bacterium]
MGDSEEPQFTGVVVAAGESTRFGPGVPKQFRLLDGRTVLERSIDALTTVPEVRGAVVVLAADQLSTPLATSLRERPDVLAVVAGGDSRARSVLAGVRAAADSSFVLIHDAARPCASVALVSAVIEATRRVGGAIPGLAVPDTVKQVGDAGTVERTLDRSTLRLAQTPQGARTDWLVAALERCEREAIAVTDEAAALEADGRTVAVVAGDPDNQKITRPEDLSRMVGGGEESEMDIRVGTGFDIHRVDESRPLVLGGLTFDGEPGLEGHSDADVVLHAAMDAVLGAAGQGDIGTLFPPGDPRFAGAASSGLAEEVASRVRALGFELLNLDLMLLAERPKIGPRVEEMRRRISDCFGIEPGRVGLKATTLERLGALGRHEGMAAQAVALLRRRAA